MAALQPHALDSVNVLTAWSAGLPARPCLHACAVIRACRLALQAVRRAVVAAWYTLNHFCRWSHPAMLPRLLAHVQGAALNVDLPPCMEVSQPPYLKPHAGGIQPRAPAAAVGAAAGRRPGARQHFGSGRPGAALQGTAHSFPPGEALFLHSFNTALQQHDSVPQMWARLRHCLCRVACCTRVGARGSAAASLGKPRCHCSQQTVVNGCSRMEALQSSVP